jgi:hypothetical protein
MHRDQVLSDWGDDLGFLFARQPDLAASDVRRHPGEVKDHPERYTLFRTVSRFRVSLSFATKSATSAGVMLSTR